MAPEGTTRYGAQSLVFLRICPSPAPLKRGAVAALVLILCLTVGEVPKEDAVVEECEAFLHPGRRATCYYDHASDLSEYYERTNDEHERDLYLKISLGLCEVLVRDGYGQWNRDTCMRSVGKNIGTTHVDVGADICTEIGSVNERDGCLKDIADIHVEQDPLVSGTLCSSISTPELQEPCISTVANTLLLIDKTAAIPYCKRLTDPTARTTCLRRAKAGDNECDTDLGERCDTHPADCPCSTDSHCLPERRRAEVNGCYTFFCGDSYCDGNEDFDSCCMDCGCSQHLTCKSGICQLRVRGEKCSNDKECDTRHCIQGTCDLLEDMQTCGSDKECLSGYCKVDVCTSRGNRGDECDRDVACTTKHCIENVCITLDIEESCVLDHECTSYHCITGKCTALGNNAGCVYDIECRSGMCENMTCFGRPSGDPCTFPDECDSYLCEEAICIKLRDGMNCTSSQNCKSSHCSKGICCYAGMDCCSSDMDCSEGGLCGESNFCVYLDTGSRDRQKQSTLLTAAGVLLGSILLAVGGIKLAYGLSGAIVERLLGRFDKELGFAMMCQKCGKRPATHGGLCSFCASGAYHKEHEGGTLSEKERKKYQVSESMLFENKEYKHKMERTKTSRAGGSGRDGIYSYFIGSGRDKDAGVDDFPSTTDTRTRKRKPSP